MFTGIIEELGQVVDNKRSSAKNYLKIKAEKVLLGTKVGDSIAVNGVCLTVTKLEKNAFFADVMPETYRKTTLESLKLGEKVNLERAVAADGRFGGHFVSGHIDGSGEICKVQREENAVLLAINVSSDLLPYIIPKGSIAIDGTSLTVAAVSAQGFSVSLIPHTFQETNLQFKSQGDKVNLETDLMAKYLANFLTNLKDQKSKLSIDYLTKLGY
ncbi:riboflavin synthase [Bacillota bacterium LX-D]|nr:riboflavin synthase [Bacillota bacterium LX-D]